MMVQIQSLLFPKDEMTGALVRMKTALTLDGARRIASNR
jgi:hypothetical protein